MVAVDLGTAITAAIYVETIYGLPGLGHAAVQALTGDGGYDLPIVVGLVLSIAIAVTVLNTAAGPSRRLGARVPRRLAVSAESLSVVSPIPAGMGRT
jgi:ABC-type antimicrobial peptide transport system permease subunit